MLCLCKVLMGGTFHSMRVAIEIATLAIEWWRIDGKEKMVLGEGMDDQRSLVMEQLKSRWVSASLGQQGMLLVLLLFITQLVRRKEVKIQQFWNSSSATVTNRSRRIFETRNINHQSHSIICSYKRKKEKENNVIINFMHVISIDEGKALRWWVCSHRSGDSGQVNVNEERVW